MNEQKERGRVLHIPAGEGRRYDMGGMRSLFLADGAETDSSYSISEWWLDPGQPGPGAHSHDANDDIFYVIEGTIDFPLPFPCLSLPGRRGWPGQPWCTPRRRAPERRPYPCADSIDSDGAASPDGPVRVADLA